MRELSLHNCRIDQRYDVREQLGRGSYSEIYLARDLISSPESPHSQVVIKALNVFLQEELDADLERTLVENFQNEALALDRVRHPNIISRIGHGTARDLDGTVFHYLVLEYLSGGDLQALIRKRETGMPRAFSYIEQICAGLRHAHSRGIIHRDIKPQNILLTADHLTVKIADFGVARLSGFDSPITRVGTNIYVPPEHSPLSAGTTGDLRLTTLTPAADIYSLAKTVYTLLTQQAPRAFSNRPITDLPEAVQSEPWSGDLLRVIKKATDNDPSERYQSVDEFWVALAEVNKTIEIGKHQPSGRFVIESPQPHISLGYTPIAPPKPDFEPIAAVLPALQVSGTVDARVPRRVVQTGTADHLVANSVVAVLPNSRKRSGLRTFAKFAIVLAIFAGILYGTAGYMRGKGIIPTIRNPFRSQTGVANTDIYLRPSPNTDNDPIGLVTKNSKVRIVNSQNNWYQVDVIEQGRDRGVPATATRGWLNGKYLDIAE